MAVDGSADVATSFLAWWAAHVGATLGSLDARRAAPARRIAPGWRASSSSRRRASRRRVLDDPGCNLSMWNLHDRHTLAGRPGGVLVDGRWPLRFLNLPGFDPDRPYRLARMREPRARQPLAGPARALRALCARAAADAAGAMPIAAREVGRRLADGLVYDDSLRAIYARALALGDDFEDLFSEEGSRAFLAWLADPPPPAPHTESTATSSIASRASVRTCCAPIPTSTAMTAAATSPGAGRSGATELAIPDRFMPPRPGSGAVRARHAAGSAGAPVAPQRAAGADGTAGRRAAPGRARDRLPRPHARARRGGSRLRAGARRGRRPGQHGERAAAPSGAAGGARGGVRPARLRGPRPRGRPRLRDRRRQRRRAPRLRGAARRGLLRGAADRDLGLGDEQHPVALAARVRARARRSGSTRGSWPRTSARSRRCRCIALPPPVQRPPSRPRRCAWVCPKASCSCSCSTT